MCVDFPNPIPQRQPHNQPAESGMEYTCVLLRKRNGINLIFLSTKIKCSIAKT